MRRSLPLFYDFEEAERKGLGKDCRQEYYLILKIEATA